jgi:hypothetical protein
VRPSRSQARSSACVGLDGHGHSGAGGVRLLDRVGGREGRQVLQAEELEQLAGARKRTETRPRWKCRRCGAAAGACKGTAVSARRSADTTECHA